MPGNSDILESNVIDIPERSGIRPFRAANRIRFAARFICGSKMVFERK